MFKMTPTILRNFVSRRATRLYPLEVRPPFDGVRGALCNDVTLCNFCGICAAKCPSRCIGVDKKSATWQCDPFACVFCGICALPPAVRGPGAYFSARYAGNRQGGKAADRRYDELTVLLQIRSFLTLAPKE